MKKITRVLIATAILATCNIALAKSPRLSLAKSTTSDYLCNDGSKVKATFYNLSDKSLSFVKLTVDGEMYTLPQVVSASGTRYTDLNKIELFTKSDTALLNKDVSNEKSAAIECKAK